MLIFNAVLILAGLVALAGRCRLTHISLSQCKKITDSGVCSLLKASRGGVLALSLENCHHITDVTMFTLARTNCSTASFPRKTTLAIAESIPVQSC